ncbi:putative HAD superfamily protein [Helianthus anomalus]
MGRVWVHTQDTIFGFGSCLGLSKIFRFGPGWTRQSANTARLAIFLCNHDPFIKKQVDLCNFCLLMGSIGPTEIIQGLLKLYHESKWVTKSYKTCYLKRVYVTATSCRHHHRHHSTMPLPILFEFVGYEKPDAQIFETALDQISVEAAKAVHVGDDQKADKIGANAVGINCWLWGTEVKTFSDIQDCILVPDL